MVFLQNGFANDAVITRSWNDTIVTTAVGKTPVGCLDIPLAMMDEDDFIGSSISVDLSLLSVWANAICGKIFVEHHRDAIGDGVTASGKITGFDVVMAKFLICTSVKFEFADRLS